MNENPPQEANVDERKPYEMPCIEESACFETLALCCARTAQEGTAECVVFDPGNS